MSLSGFSSLLRVDFVAYTFLLSLLCLLGNWTRSGGWGTPVVWLVACKGGSSFVVREWKITLSTQNSTQITIFLFSTVTVLWLSEKLPKKLPKKVYLHNFKFSFAKILGSTNIVNQCGKAYLKIFKNKGHYCRELWKCGKVYFTKKYMNIFICYRFHVVGKIPTTTQICILKHLWATVLLIRLISLTQYLHKYWTHISRNPELKELYFLQLLFFLRKFRICWQILLCRLPFFAI